MAGLTGCADSLTEQNSQARACVRKSPCDMFLCRHRDIIDFEAARRVGARRRSHPVQFMQQKPL